MAGFKEHLESDLNVFFNTDEFAEPAIYSGTGQEIMAVVERGHTMDKGNTFATDGYSDRALITVKKSDVEGWQQGDTFTDKAGVKWEIAHLVEDNLVLITFECIANERVPFG